MQYEPQELKRGLQCLKMEKVRKIKVQERKVKKSKRETWLLEEFRLVQCCCEINDNGGMIRR